MISREDTFPQELIQFLRTRETVRRPNQNPGRRKDFDYLPDCLIARRMECGHRLHRWQSGTPQTPEWCQQQLLIRFSINDTAIENPTSPASESSAQNTDYRPRASLATSVTLG